MLFAPSAQAADFQVNTLADHAADGCEPLNPPVAATDCTLRDAVTAANASPTDDTVTASGLSGTIRLTAGEISIGSFSYDPSCYCNRYSQDALTISGPGPGTLSVSGDANADGAPGEGDSRIFNVVGQGPATVSRLTLTEGYSSGYYGGGALLSSNGADVTIANSAITDSSTFGAGGAIRSVGDLTISDSTISGNVATAGGGGGIVSYGELTVTKSTISGNNASSQGGAIRSAAPTTISGSTISGNDAGGGGGGVASRSSLTLEDTEVSGNDTTNGDGGGIVNTGALTVTKSTISGNTANSQGGGIHQSGKYGSQLTDSVISGNTASSGGGIHFATPQGKYGSTSASRRVISRTTISGNDADYRGAGMYVDDLNDGDRFTVSHSTISGNDSAVGQESSSFGGGIMFGGTVRGDFDLVNSTISGNTADFGGGVSLGDASGRLVGPTGSLEFGNSTIASNSAASTGGGFYLGRYASNDGNETTTSATIPLTSTIVADNTAAGAPQDLDRADGSTGGGFDLSFSLVESPGDAPLPQSPPGSNIVGVDPRLAPLADNGGPTRTHLPAPTSPAIDRGNAPARLATDQRGQARTVDQSVPNAAAGDGTDMGSVELGAFPPVTPPNPPPNPPPPEVGSLPPPVLGVTVNVRPLSGRVFISLPPAASSARRLITGPLAAAVPGLKGRRFVPLRAARQIPVRSLLDTRKGKVRITSALPAAGKTQSGDFNAGVFQVLQSRARRARGLTELNLKGSSFAPCKKRRPAKRRGRGATTPAQTSASRRIRRLSSNANGRFRTRGRHSSATVRGTKWTVTDRCDGTLTQVARGSVTVRDFRRKKTIVVRAGKSYLARARGR